MCLAQERHGEPVTDNSAAVQGMCVNAMALCRVDEMLQLLNVESAPMHVGTVLEHGFMVPGNFASCVLAQGTMGACCEI